LDRKGGFRPLKIVDIHLDHPLPTLVDLEEYEAVEAMIHLHGAALGSVRVPVAGGSCSAGSLADAIVKDIGSSALSHLVDDWLATGFPTQPGTLDSLLGIKHPDLSVDLPSMSVAVCTRDRPEHLATCLASIELLRYASLNVIVVDNAPSNDSTESLVRERFPRVRYVRETRPGLDWARNRAIAESSSEVIAFTDDDVVVDPHWATAIGSAFAEEESLAAVTGLVAPLELSTPAQVLFERYGGFGRGFVRRWYRAGPRSNDHIWGGGFGTGANMAFRRRVFEEIGPFDPALDVGTITNGAGDSEMFFRVLQEGYSLRYEPAALVRHRHRRDYHALYTQLTNHGIGFYSCLVRCALAYPEKRSAIARFALSWLRRWSIRRLLLSFFRPSRFPRELIVAELKGSLKGLTLYPRSRRTAQGIAHAHGGDLPPIRRGNPRPRHYSGNIAVRNVELGTPVPSLPDVTGHARVRVYVHCNDRLLGFVEVTTLGDAVSAAELRSVIGMELRTKLLAVLSGVDEALVWGAVPHALRNSFLLPADGAPHAGGGLALDRSTSVTVVVRTLGRPDDLRACLSHLLAQQTSRAIAVVVVDNDPSSDAATAVVDEFPGVKLVRETRRGAAYARNAGILGSSGDIIAMIDDDVRPPPDWVEKIVSPLARNDVAAVTGSILPSELEANAQYLFELYGGPGRGFEVKEANEAWFENSKYAVPTWQLGGMANVAVRASVLAEPGIGLLLEALGPRMPAAAGEDAYLFYKILKAGHTIIYEPSAFVWHRGEGDGKALEQHVRAHSKGQVAYHLTTLIEDGDLRAVPQLFFKLPKALARKLVEGVIRAKPYALRMSLLEARSVALGPVAFLRSRLRIRRGGPSHPRRPA
jgi:GT2 family glycosyltransferase